MAYNTYPAVDENYKFPAPVRQAIADSTELASKVDSIVGAKWMLLTQPTLADATDFNTINRKERTGFHPVATSVSAKTMVNIPAEPGKDPEAGVLMVNYLAGVAATGAHSMIQRYLTVTGILYTRNVTSVSTNTWSAWTTSNMKKGSIASGADLNTFMGVAYAGDWYVSSSTVANTLLNLPAGSGPGTLRVITAGPAAGSYTTQMYFSSGTSTPKIMWRAMINTTTFGAWFNLPDENTGIVPKWKPNTVYTTNQWAVSPRGNFMYASADHTSPSTFTAATEANWIFLNAASRGWLPMGADFNTMIDAGTWIIPNQATADAAVNWPAGLARAPGIFKVEGDYRFGSTIVFAQTLWTYGSTTGKRERTKLSGAAGAWNPWTDPYAMTDVSSAMLSDYAMSNNAHKDAFIRRRGGSIGTNGIAALALRWDHGAIPFRDKLLPKLIQRNLPSSFVINPSDYRLGLAENSGVTWADYHFWAKHYGIEFVNHGMDHLDAANTAELKVQLVDSKPIIQSNISTQAIELFSPPGVTGTGLLDPWVSTNTPEHFTAKWEPARYVLENHAFSSGYIPGLYRDLDGIPANGETHWTMDSETSPDNMIARIQTAQALGSGIQIMLHPSQVDLTDKITLATFNAIIDYIADERDAGRLKVLTMGGLFMANSRSSFRHNILRNPGFNGTDGWNTTGYTLSGGAAQSSTSAGLLSQIIDLTNRAFFAGAQRELTATFTADASGAVARIQLEHTAAGIDVNEDFTLGPNQSKTVYLPALLPIWAGSNLPVFRAGRVSGGAVKVENVGALAV